MACILQRRSITNYVPFWPSNYKNEEEYAFRSQKGFFVLQSRKDPVPVKDRQQHPDGPQADFRIMMKDEQGKLKLKVAFGWDMAALKAMVSAPWESGAHWRLH